MSESEQPIIDLDEARDKARTYWDRTKKYYMDHAEPILVGSLTACAIIVIGTKFGRRNKELLVLHKKQLRRLARGNVDGMVPGVEYTIKNQRLWLVPAALELGDPKVRRLN